MNPETAASPPAPPPRALRFGLRFKVLLGLTLFNIAATLVFTVTRYVSEKEHILADLRDKLDDFAHGLPYLLPDGYLDRAVSAGAVTPEEYRRLVERLNRYCREVGLRYLYTYFRGEAGFHCTATNCPPTEKFTPYWEFYDTVPPAIAQAWETGRPVYGYVEDKWGRTFTLFAPARTPAGQRYIAGADLPVPYVDERLNASLRQSLYVGAGSFLLFFLISAFASTHFSRQITQLAAYTRELAQTSFQSNPASELRRRIVALPARSRDEVGELARSFLVMEEQLGSYLQRLQAETAAKERAQNELRIAGEIQLSLLPQAFPKSELLDLHAAMKPAKEAGGDFYDFFFLDADHLCFAIGDVSDKGMPAALFMAVALTTLRAKATPERIDTPDEILRETNELLIPQNQSAQFVTLFLGVLNVHTGVVAYADGGHNRPYRRTAGGDVGMLTIPPREGMALGVMPGAGFRRHTLQLAPGDTLFLYTDGVTEAIAADETFYREARLQRVLAELPAAATARHCVETVMDDVFAFARGHVQADDITLLAVRRKG